MKITRYLWINNLPKRCQEEDIQTTFQSHGKIQNIRIHENNHSRGAVVAFIDCKSSAKAFECVKTLKNVTIKMDYCESNGEPGITSLGTKNSCSKDDTRERSNHNSDSRSRSSSSSSNTSSFGSSLDDCSKYPTIPLAKKLENNNSIENTFDKLGSKSPRTKPINEIIADNIDKNDKDCLNKDYRGLLVENLSQRSSDTSLREGLFHEYKKHGKITSVAVMGQGGGRYAIISFKRSEDMEKAYEASSNKVFFGNPIRVKKHNGYNYIDPDLCPPEHAMDEYHPKATKTLFVGKLATGAVVELDLRKVFKKYGEIIDIDIKTQSNQPDTSFAFVQYYDISSVVRALRNQDAIKVDGKPVKLGFGKSQPANCLWVGNLQRNANDSFLRRHFKRFGSIMLVIPDPEYSCALIQFDGAEDALRAFTDTRERSNNTNVNKRMQVDYASNEYQVAFMNRLRKSCQLDTQDFLKNITDPYQTEKIQNLLISYTKCLGLLDETRTRSYDRYDTKSDYDDYDDFYPSHQSRQRKSVHQRLYNDSYGVDDDYSDEYHYSKPKSRHYDEYSSSRSPVRYSRAGQKYQGEQYGSHESRRPNYRAYSGEYYDGGGKTEPSSSTYYPYRRTPDHSYMHSNHNRSYSPSPASSVDYGDDYHRYNLSPKRYSRSNKDYHASHSRQRDLHDGHEPHFDRTLEVRNWSKQSRREADGYGGLRSKSDSKGKLPESGSPHVRTSGSRLRAVKTELAKKNRTRKAVNNNDHDDVRQKSPAGKVAPSVNNNSSSSNSSRPLGNNSKTKPSVSSSSSVATVTTKTAVAVGVVTSVVQPVDALSKLERERAKLLEELSLLSEDTSAGAANVTNKTTKVATKLLDSEALKSRKKAETESDVVVVPKVAATVVVVVDKKCSAVMTTKEEPTVPETKVRVKEAAKVDRISAPGITTSSMAISIGAGHTKHANASTSECGPKTEASVAEVSKVARTLSTDLSSQCRDPRLNPISYQVRPCANSHISLSPVDIVLPPMSTTAETTVEPATPVAPASSSYKDSNSDSDVDHFSSIDFDLDKRIRELDAKMNRNEQTVRTLDYSKFRIRKKGADGTLNPVATSLPLTSSPCSMVSPTNSLVTSSSLLDVGYSSLGRDTGSNTSDFIKTMLNQTKQKTYHSISESDSIHSSYSMTSTTCSMLPFRTVDLGANDIERRSLFSRFGSSASNSLSFSDSRTVHADISMLSPTTSSYAPRPSGPPTAPTTVTSLSKLSAPCLIVSPTTTVSTASTPGTPNGIESNQPMKSILKKYNPSLSQPCKPSNKLYDTQTITPKMKSSQELFPSSEFVNNAGPDKHARSNKVTSSNLKRNIKQEPDDVDCKSHVKRTKSENGPALDDTLFQTFPTMPTKKVKSSLRKPASTSSESKSQPAAAKKSSKFFEHCPVKSEKPASQKPVKESVSASVSKLKVCKDGNKSPTKMLLQHKKTASSVALKTSQLGRGKTKSMKLDKSKKMKRRSKEKLLYANRRRSHEVADELDDEVEEDRFSDGNEEDLSGSSDGNYESMYDKIKRRKSKTGRVNGAGKRRHAFGKKRRSKQTSEVAAASSDNLDSEDSEYWSVKSSKRALFPKRKRPRLSDISSSHFSDSNSCKTTPCGKADVSLHLADYGGGTKSGMGHTKTLYGLKSNEDAVKDESITDESKAPAESFNLSSPHNSSQCSSPKYGKDNGLLYGEVSHANEQPAPSSTITTTTPAAASSRHKSLHRPHDGPLKKRPITEPIVLSEDLPYLEKQREEEYSVCSPTSINDEPPSQLESMYDMPACQQTNVLEEVVIDDQHHSLDVVDSQYLVGQQQQQPPPAPLSSSDSHQMDTMDPVDESPLPADVNSASHILLTMKSQPSLDSDPDQQLQSVAEHLISLAHNAAAASTFDEQASPPGSPDEEGQQQQHALEMTVARPGKASQRQDDEVTIYVKNIIDRIKQETDVANTSNRDKLVCKRAKKMNTFSVPTSRPIVTSHQSSHECRHIQPMELESTTAKCPLAAVVCTQSATQGTLPLAYVAVSSHTVSAESMTQVAPIQALKTAPVESVQSDEAASTSSTDKRVRHNSARSDGQLHSLDETIENVVKSSMSSSASDVVSTKSLTDFDVSVDESKSITNSYEGTNITRGDLSSLEETMNEVIHKVGINSPSISASCQGQSTNDSESLKSNNSLVRHIVSNDLNKQKKININQVKQSVYQLTGNVGGITNLVLGIPSILTVNTLNQQNHMVSFQNAVSGQNQLTLPLTKLAVSSIQTNATVSSCSQVMSSLALTPTGINLQNMQKHGQNGAMSVQSTEMVFTKLNSLTPIMIQAPLRSLSSMAHTINNSLSSQSMVGHNQSASVVGSTYVSIAAAMPACSTFTETVPGKLASLSLTTSGNKPITTPVNMLSRTPMPTSHGLNLAKISSTPMDSNYYLMMQQQTGQPKSKVPNMCQSASSDVNLSGLTANLNAGHSIILSHLTHTNNVLSPINPAYLTASINRSNTTSVPLQTLTSANGIATTCPSSSQSILFRPLTIHFPKFEEKDDWLKQNKQLELHYPIRWTGKLCLKNDEVFVQMHMLAGNEDLIRNSMNLISAGQALSQPLRIVQRMRLEPNQLEGLQRRLARRLEFCTCLTLAGGDKADELARTSSTLNDNFINYLQEKSAAGIINISIPDQQQGVHSYGRSSHNAASAQNAYVIHIFPPCEFSDNQLRSCSTKLYEQLKENSVPYLVIVITTV